MAALLFAIKHLGLIKEAISAGKEIAELVKYGRDKLQQMHDEKRDPTEAEWLELNAKIRVLQEELHK